MVKIKKNYIIAILIVAVLTLSLFASSIAIFGKRNIADNANIPSPSNMTNIEIKDDNGKVDVPTTGGGVAISTTQQLKDFLLGNAEYGYLTNDISDFKWEKESADRHGASNIEFAPGRTLDGNGYKITVSQSDGLTNEYPMLTTNKAVKMYWTGGVKSSSGASSQDVYASSFLIAVNQGTIKNLNMDVKVKGNLEWVPSGGRNNNKDWNMRNANSWPLFFGFMTGVNFGVINNSTVNYLQESNFTIYNANDSSSLRWAKEERNDLEIGGFAGVNAGEISYATGSLNGYFGIISRASNKDETALGVNTGNANARAIFGILVGRMQSDPMAERNLAKLTSATLTNSIVTGKGNVNSDAYRSGSGTAYVHTGSAVGANSPYSGTVVNPVRQQGYGVVDGIISDYTGALTRTTSGSPPAQNYRAVIDCGKISNVIFKDAYDGAIDNCSCVGGEHIATRANGIKNVYGDGNITMQFSKEDTANATLIFEITPKSAEAGKVDDNIIYAVSKRDRSVRDGANITQGQTVALFNYDNETYYSQYSDQIKQTSKHAIIEVVEPRASSDINSYILELEFGRQVKAVYETSTVGVYNSYDEKLGREIATFSYDGAEKGVAKIVSLQDGIGQDTFEENISYRVFKSKYRTENQALEEAFDYTMDLVYPGVYTDIYIQSSTSAKQSYLDNKLRIVAPLEKDKNGAIITKEFKITPAHIAAKNSGNDVNVGGEGTDKDDIDTNKLFAQTYARFEFDFTLFTINQNGERQELRKTTSGSGASQIVTYPYDRIEYSDDGYVYKTVMTYNQFEAGEKFVVDKSTHPVNGRNYYFRAVKELRDANGVLKMTTTITLESKNYKVKIDGEAPEISAKMVGGVNNGIDYLKWNERNNWKKDAFTLEINVVEATSDGLTFYKKVSGADDSTGELLQLDNFKTVQTFSDDKVYVYYSFDKYGNRSLDYIVSAKIDSVIPEFQLKAGLKDFAGGGIINIDGTDVVEKTVVNGKVTADRSVELSVDLTQKGASGATVYYSLNNGDWTKITDNNIVINKVINNSYYLDDGSVDRAIYDKISIKVVSGSKIETISSVIYEVQVNKSVILVDKDEVTTVDGIFVTKGIRREHLTKTYTSNNALGKGLIDILNNAIKEELFKLNGETREAGKEIYVEGYYMSSNVGDNIPIVLNVIDPLDVYTINANKLNLEGFIAPALINVTVNEAMREYGRPNPKFTYSVTGLLGSDTIDLSQLIKTPEYVNSATPVNREGINLIVPTKGHLIGNYRIGTVDSTRAKLIIKPQELIEITYDDAYLDFAYNGEPHFIKGTYKLPNGVVQYLDVEYYNSVTGELISDGVVDIGTYKAVFKTSDTNYTLNPTRATIYFEVHKGFVNFDVPESQLNLKYNGQERTINPILSNGSTPIIRYYNDTNTLIHDGVQGSYPIASGTYKVTVEYNNDKDADAQKVGKYYNNFVEYTMVINKVSMAESGIKWSNVNKKYDGKLSRIVVSNIPIGTQIPEGLTPGEEEGSYILMERTDVGEETLRFAFRNPNIIEQELVATIKISKAVFDDYNVKFGSLETTFDNQPHSVILENLPDGIDVNVKAIQGTTPGVDLDISGRSVTKTEAGLYKIKLQLSNDNFVTKNLEATLNIKKAKVTTAKADPVKVKYDGKEHYAIIRGVPSDVNMESKTTIEIKDTSGSTTKYYATPMNAERTEWRTPIKVNSGNYTYRAIITNANYEVGTFVDGQFSIEKATYEDFGTKAENKNVVYNGEQHTLQLVNVPDGTIYLDALGNPIDGFVNVTDAGNYVLDVRLSNPNIADFGNHFVAWLNVAAKENTNNYSLNSVTADYDPNNKLEVAFDKSQLGADFTIEFNKLEGMSVNDNVLTFDYAGTYDVVAFVVNKNYLPVKVTAKIVINKIIAPYADSLIIKDQNTIYNGNQQRPAVEGLDGYDDVAINYAYSGAIIIGGTPINVGKYNVTVTVSHKNYISIVKDIVFVIEAANLTDNGYFIESASYVYDGTARSVGVLSLSGVPVSGYVAKLTYGDLPYGELPSKAGTYIVSGVLSKPNYNDLQIANEGILVIRKAESPELQVKDVTGKFNGKSQKIAVSRVDGETLNDYTVKVYKNGILLEDGIVDSGEYICTVVVTQTNYTTKTFNINVKITAKEVAITYENVENPIQGNEFVLKGTYKDISGKVQEVIFVYPDGFKPTAGKHTIGVKIADYNYTPTAETASVEIEIKGENIGAIAGGSAGGAAAVGIGVGLFFILKKKKISL